MTEPDGTGYSLREAVDEAISEGRAVRAHAREVVGAATARVERLEALLGRAMLALCEHGETRRSSALVAEIHAALEE